MSANSSLIFLLGNFSDEEKFKMWERHQFFSTLENNGSLYSNTMNVGVPYEIPRAVKWSLLILYVVIIIVALGGNLVVCWTVFTKQRLRTVTNFFIVSLSVSDIIMTILCIPLTLLSNMFFYYWPFGHFLCPFVGYLQLMSVILRAFTLVALTCDRHYVIWRPLKQRLKKLHAKFIILSLWVAAAIIALPTALHSKIIYLPFEPGSKGLCIESWENHNARYAYSVSIMLLQYFVPLFLMLVTYIHIGVIVWIKRPPGEADKNRDMRLQRSKRKTVKMLIAVVIAYAFTWMPLHVITLIGDINPEIYDEMYVHIIWLFAHFLAFINCATNPIIYCWMNSTFRSAFVNIFKKIQCVAISNFRKTKVLSRRSRSQVKSFSMHRSQNSKEQSIEKVLPHRKFNNIHTTSTC
ncbi:hypothetical protein FSP39_003227 [Pinctada imbricata]|uniref:G-protein coupled receptors family 1 profile domain-containing protein n=1 Tax=Pinctada imbricata TaxID=66713 RepID=A0AA88XPI8_PINIB|nr:hypothetical protein FSP39_003227 [Pinctada imbricata]